MFETTTYTIKALDETTPQRTSPKISARYRDLGIPQGVPACEHSERARTARQPWGSRNAGGAYSAHHLVGRTMRIPAGQFRQ
jgi:hypothetical protein